MSIKTSVAYSCMVFCFVALIVALKSDHWHTYQIQNDRENTITTFNVGLWDSCATVEFLEDGAPKDPREVQTDECERYEPPESIGSYAPKRNVLFIACLINLILILICCIFVSVYAITKKYYFPHTRTVVFFIINAVLLTIGQLVYASMYIGIAVSFSWSYGTVWAAVMMYVISTILIFADR